MTKKEMYNGLQIEEEDGYFLFIDCLNVKRATHQPYSSNYFYLNLFSYVFYCSTECLCEGKMFSRIVIEQTWMLFKLIFIYFIVALNVFVKGGCPAGWLQNKRECYLHFFFKIFYCSTECLCEGRMSSRIVIEQTWMLFTLIFVYFIVALNVFVKGGCPAGW
jgi:hypothetical protein